MQQAVALTLHNQAHMLDLCNVYVTSAIYTMYINASLTDFT